MKVLKTICWIFITVSISFSQADLKKTGDVFVDDKGVMRWSDSKTEVSLFGVNYTTPFAYAYRAQKKLGLSLKQAIDLDVAQMKRLGFDAFRVHVWDREISDKQGNLLKNEHLDLFDYLIAKLSESGIKSIITPIAWWGTGWPEPDPDNPGFSQMFSNSKVDLITKPEARAAQRNYLSQFINHVNPYTKHAYKNEPSVIAVEIINEPHHPNDAEQVTNYINEMYDVLRNAGLTKPIFYNISENWNDVQANAVAKSKAEGVSFQWYPTGLVHNKMLKGNYLINVNKYAIPSQNVEGFDKKSKMVYEFDAADIGGSFMYPAMARSYREAGMQFAAMFSYDPVQIAWSNTEYPTHFVNLLYAPSKAISLMIAGKVFHKIPLKKSFGDFPQNNSFDEFRISYEDDLSELNSESEFYYSNSTKTVSVYGASLKHVAGIGSSNIVKYDGTGAYFLDKLENGIWRLEVYPDVLWIRDPFEQTSMSHQVARLFWNERKIEINLDDLGEDFAIHSLIDKKKAHSNRNEFSVEPGIYILEAKKNKNDSAKKYLSKKEKFLDGLFIPFKNIEEIYVVNDTKPNITEYGLNNFKLKIASEKKIKNAALYVRKLGWRGFEKHPLENICGFDYFVSDSVKNIQPGKYEYCVAVETNDGTFTFPEGIKSAPGDWDFSTGTLWGVNVLGENDPVTLLNAYRDRKDFVFSQMGDWRRFRIDYVNGSEPDCSAISVNANPSEKDTLGFGIQLNIAKYVGAITQNINNYDEVVIKARTAKDSSCNFKIVLLTKDGKSFGADVQAKNLWNEISIPLSTFESCDALILPNSYPKFLPKIWKGNKKWTNIKNELKNLEFVQIITEPQNNKQNYELEIESVSLKKHIDK